MDALAKKHYREPALKALLEAIKEPDAKLYIKPGVFTYVKMLVMDFLQVKKKSLAQKLQELTKTKQFSIQGECPICLEELQGDKFLLPCGHTYHFDCFSTWHVTCSEKGEDTTCTLCRGVFSEMMAGVRETDEDQVLNLQLVAELSDPNTFEVRPSSFFLILSLLTHQPPTTQPTTIAAVTLSPLSCQYRCSQWFSVVNGDVAAVGDRVVTVEVATVMTDNITVTVDR
jgi:hypothetical protein